MKFTSGFRRELAGLIACVLSGFNPGIEKGIIPGRLRAKSLSEEDFCEVVGVPGGEQSFILDTQLFALFVFQHAQSESADHAEVGIAVAFADSAIVFAP